jgi:hypothetical protein
MYVNVCEYNLVLKKEVNCGMFLMLDVGTGADMSPAVVYQKAWYESGQMIGKCLSHNLTYNLTKVRKSALI